MGARRASSSSSSTTSPSGFGCLCYWGGQGCTRPPRAPCQWCCRHWGSSGGDGHPGGCSRADPSPRPHPGREDTALHGHICAGRVLSCPRGLSASRFQGGHFVTKLWNKRRLLLCISLTFVQFSKRIKLAHTPPPPCSDYLILHKTLSSRGKLLIFVEVPVRLCTVPFPSTGRQNLPGWPRASGRAVLQVPKAAPGRARGQAGRGPGRSRAHCHA